MPRNKTRGTSVFGAQVGVDEGADKPPQVGVRGYCLVGCGGGEEVCECGVDGFEVVWIVVQPGEFAVDDAQFCQVEYPVLSLDFGDQGWGCPQIVDT